MRRVKERSYAYSHNSIDLRLPSPLESIALYGSNAKSVMSIMDSVFLPCYNKIIILIWWPATRPVIIHTHRLSPECECLNVLVSLCKCNIQIRIFNSIFVH